MKRRERNGVQWLEFERVFGEPGLSHAVTTRFLSDGSEFNLSQNLRRDDTVAGNRKRLAEALSVPLERWILCEQVHGSRLAEVGRAHSGMVIRGVDALLTRESGVALAVFSADCPLVLLWEPERRIAAAVHSGWRSTLGQIVPGVLEAIESLGGSARRVLAGVGPFICKRCFEVGQDFVERLASTWPAGMCFLKKNSGTLRFDLKEALQRQLSRGGVPEENVEFAGLCTYEAEWLFSYRRDGMSAGGFAALICSD